MSLPLKNVGLPVKNFVKIKASPQRIHIFYSTPKEILNFHILPMENSMVPQLGGADTKYNSPKSLDPPSKTHTHFQTWPQFFESWVMLSTG